MTTTKAQLEKIAENCNREAPQKGWTYGIEWAYGRPRLVLQNSNLCCRDVSPRLPNSQRGCGLTWTESERRKANSMTAQNSTVYVAYSCALRDYESAHDRLWKMPTTENSIAHREALHRYLSARAEWLAYVAQHEVAA